MTRPLFDKWENKRKLACYYNTRQPESVVKRLIFGKRRGHNNRFFLRYRRKHENSLILVLIIIHNWIIEPEKMTVGPTRWKKVGKNIVL